MNRCGRKDHKCPLDILPAWEVPVLHLGCQLTINSTTTNHTMPMKRLLSSLNPEIGLKIQVGPSTPICKCDFFTPHTHNKLKAELTIQCVKLDSLTLPLHSYSPCVIQILINELNSVSSDQAPDLKGQRSPWRAERQTQLIQHSHAASSLCHFWTNSHS